MVSVKNRVLFTGADALNALRAAFKHWEPSGLTMIGLEAQGEFAMGANGRFTLPDWTVVEDFGRKRIKLQGMRALPVHCTEGSTLRVTVCYTGEAVDANPD